MKNKSQVDTTSTHDSTARMGIAAVVILVAICLATPVFINIAFQHVAPVGTLEARWTPGELLGYAGGAFSCLGTVFLGCLTLHKNRLLRDETNRRIEVEEERSRLAFRPAFNIKFRERTGDRIGVTLRNVSPSFARNIVRSEIVGIDDKEQTKWKSDNQTIPFLDKEGSHCIQVGELDSSKLKTTNKLARIEMHLSCTNQLGKEYLFKLTGFYTDKSESSPDQLHWACEEVDIAEIER